MYHSKSVEKMLSNVKAIASDVDGTLTISRSSYRIDVDAVKAVQTLEDNGIRVILVSGNALPILMGLSRYLGASGAVVCENGCIVGYKDRVIRICKRRTLEVAKIIAEEFNDILSESWQNVYREYDFAFRVKSNKYRNRQNEVVKIIQEFLSRQGYSWVKVVSSGYAIHLRPLDSDKGKGLLKALEVMGISPQEVVGIGDGANDVELFKVVGLAVAVANADPELIRYAHIVLTKPSGKGFAELASMILRARG